METSLLLSLLPILIGSSLLLALILLIIYLYRIRPHVRHDHEITYFEEHKVSDDLPLHSTYTLHPDHPSPPSTTQYGHSIHQDPSSTSIPHHLHPYTILSEDDPSSFPIHHPPPTYSSVYSSNTSSIYSSLPSTSLPSTCPSQRGCGGGQMDYVLYPPGHLPSPHPPSTPSVYSMDRESVHIGQGRKLVLKVDLPLTIWGATMLRPSPPSLTSSAGRA
ncbi:MAG: hypothetical protein DHS80DRAFT_23143 [Piptocephalis tieghemiana]|nr:MAG: hypothetical protein DHS80DRAFT_23143 [Piptocephalis tieghemiana]